MSGFNPSHHHRLHLKESELKQCLELITDNLQRMCFTDDGFNECYGTYRKLNNAIQTTNTTWKVNLKPEEHQALTQALADWTDVLALRTAIHDMAYGLYLKVKQAKTYANQTKPRPKPVNEP